MRRTRRFLAATILVAGCNVGGGTGVDPNDPNDPDDPDDPNDPGTAELCLVESDYSNLPGQVAVQRNQSGSMGTLHYFVLDSKLNADATFDAVQVQLWDQRGVFAGGAV